MPLRIPDLNERSEDVLLLAQSFLQEETRKLEREQTSFSSAAITALTSHDWPGNIHELQNRIRRALGTTMDRVITPVDLELEDIPLKQKAQKLATLKEAREEAEIKAVRRAFTLSNNNISQAAKLLEISRPTLHDLLKKHGISIDK